jgi:hypothetical protein
MILKAIRRRCEARLRDFPFPTPFNARTFCDTLGALRGRPIVLAPRTMPLDLTGLWVPLDTVDYILYACDESPRHQQQIIFHEAAHPYLGHRPVLRAAPAWLALTPGLDRGRMLEFLARRSPADPEEQEAEVTATLLMGRLDLATALAPANGDEPVDPIIEALVERLADDME